MLLSNGRSCCNFRFQSPFQQHFHSVVLMETPKPIHAMSNYRRWIPKLSAPLLWNNEAKMTPTVDHISKPNKRWRSKTIEPSDFKKRPPRDPEIFHCLRNCSLFNIFCSDPFTEKQVLERKTTMQVNSHRFSCIATIWQADNRSICLSATGDILTFYLVLSVGPLTHRFLYNIWISLNLPFLLSSLYTVHFQGVQKYPDFNILMGGFYTFTTNGQCLL